MRRISRNHQREHPRNLLFIDTEAYRGNPNGTETEESLLFRLVCFRPVKHYGTNYVDDEMICETRKHLFWEQLSKLAREKSVLWVFAHNIWFDLTMLGIKELMDNGRIKLAKPHKTCKACLEGSCKNCRCWKGSVSLDPGASFASTLIDGCRVNFVDSFNYFRSSLATIATSHGLEKTAMPGAADSESEWKAYCSNDVDICKTAICELIKHWYTCDLGNFQFTAPGLAFSCYRHRFMNESIVVHDNKYVRDDEKAAYYGGQVEVFFRGRITQVKPNLYHDGGFEQKKHDAYYVGPVWHVDCNSLYPFVMRNGLFPSMYLGTMSHPAINDVTDRIDEYAMVASVELLCTDNTYPFRCDNRIWFPNGRFPTTLCGPELAFAFRRNEVTQVYHVHLYEQKYLFKEWVDFWHTNRLAAIDSGRKAYDEFCKLMLNSLGGKFAQQYRKWRVDSRSRRFVEWGKWPRWEPAEKAWRVCRALGKIVQVQDAKVYADHAMVAISAYITSYGREHMRMIRNVCGEYNILYQDTDSLFLTKAGFNILVAEQMIDPMKLGLFKVKEVILEGGIYGRQDYEADGRIVKAGLPKNAERIGDRRWSYREIESPESMLSRLPDGTIRVKRRILSGSELCCGRSYGSNGRSVPRNAVSIMRECGLNPGE